MASSHRNYCGTFFRGGSMKRRTMRAVMLALAMLVAIPGAIAVAGPLDDANAAFDRKDYATAFQLLRPLASQGIAEAQLGLGVHYENGWGVPRDYAEAAKWYRLAAVRGYAIAQNNLGTLYYRGHGVPQSYAEAAKWERLAAERGSATAQNNLGGLYYEGHDVPQSYAEAAKWYRLAAIQGYAPAQSNLGALYRRGQGLPQDSAEAAKWERLAIAQGYELARENLQQLANETPLATAATPMQLQGGTFVVPVVINNAITLNFIVDSGAADVSIPADVVLTLMRTGTLEAADFYAEKTTYVLADGSKVPSETFRIRSLKVGDKVVENVNGNVGSQNGQLLLGQSFLLRFKSWSIDNTRHVLVLD
jgi:TPR repeat protein